MRVSIYLYNSFIPICLSENFLNLDGEVDNVGVKAALSMLRFYKSKSSLPFSYYFYAEDECVL